jgi:Zn-dependent peptidase ImmA (M78 family)/transcriptional regulator with XRE-family HTH domain
MMSGLKPLQVERKAAMDARSILDTMDPAVLGERLAEARRARRMTQQQAAEQLDVARTTIVAMEKGDRRPRPGELVALARFYGRSVGDLVREEPATKRPSFLVQFRAAGTSASSKTSAADIAREADIKRFEDVCGWYVDLETWADSPLPKRYPPAYAVAGTPWERAAEEVAGSERNRLGLGDGPVGDLWGLLETDVGLRVFALAMQDRRIAGVFLFTEEFGGCIAVNANHPEDYRRWSAAHEYAHFLTDRYRAEVTVFNSNRRQPESERLADAFARNFLMPASGLQRRFDSMRRAKNAPITTADVLALSHLYHVSFQAMAWRLEDLKLLPTGTWETLRERGFKPKEAQSLIHLSPHEPGLSNLPIRYEALAVQAYEAGLLTEGQLAERLMTDRVGARERVVAVKTQDQASENGVWQQVELDLALPLAGVG